ncbi:MBL fold metallo-hydrolase [Actinomadura litoris]|uniref:MBL fold metallo-hydrolase n=1 Tax=Actinomadura litoris TaxID=2678616 RepID=A0A7K1L0V1_9ACTN|nr:MBL fold metallo-hydrolase [Actinomadura litoris]MUN37967.1 MBL fold metallo-hydrolase [Actinomadura litoris]
MDVIRLLPGLHLLRFPVANAYLWQDPDGLTLIDTYASGSAPLIAKAIRDLGHDPADLRRLVLTHFHEDHVGAAAEIAEWGDVRVIAHRADAPFIRGETTGPPPILADWERPILEQARKQLPAEPPAPVHVDHELDDGDVLDFGGGAQAVAAPGHTPGSVALHLPGPKVLFTGDTVARTPDGSVILGVFNADPPAAAASFQRLAALDTEIACFGHGEPLTQNAARALRTATQNLLPP